MNQLTNHLNFYPRKTIKVKASMVGSFAVGKTSLVRRYVLDMFDDRYLATIGAKITKKELSYRRAKEEIRVEMTIWDIMGEKGFRDLLKEAYFEGTNGVLAICDLTKADTLFELSGWIDTIFRVSGQVPIVFLGNKVDLEDSIVLTERDVEQMASRFKSPYFLTSAKTGENVQTAFAKLGDLIIGR